MEKKKYNISYMERMERAFRPEGTQEKEGIKAFWKSFLEKGIAVSEALDAYVSAYAAYRQDSERTPYDRVNECRDRIKDSLVEYYAVRQSPDASEQVPAGEYTAQLRFPKKEGQEGVESMRFRSSGGSARDLFMRLQEELSMFGVHNHEFRVRDASDFDVVNYHLTDPEGMSYDGMSFVSQGGQIVWRKS